MIIKSAVSPSPNADFRATLSGKSFPCVLADPPWIPHPIFQFGGERDLHGDVPDRRPGGVQPTQEDHVQRAESVLVGHRAAVDLAGDQAA